MKKIMVAVFAVCLALGLTACGTTKASSSSSDAPAQVFNSVNDELNPYLVIVNKENKLPDDWLSRVKLVTAQNSLGEELQVEEAALGHFEDLRNELLEEGIDIELDSVYRSVEEQQEIWDEWLDEYGEDYCRQYLAVPGYSEHHTGLALDIFLIKDGKTIRENDDMIADEADFAKIHQALPKHGFILRYMPGKEDITGYAYEPWHLRYVGQDVAEIISSRGITLEEFIGLVK